jgi:hypothetical protein
MYLHRRTQMSKRERGTPSARVHAPPPASSPTPFPRHQRRISVLAAHLVPELAVVPSPPLEAAPASMNGFVLEPAEEECGAGAAAPTYGMGAEAMGAVRARGAHAPLAAAALPTHAPRTHRCPAGWRPPGVGARAWAKLGCLSRPCPRECRHAQVIKFVDPIPGLEPVGSLAGKTVFITGGSRGMCVVSLQVSLRATACTWMCNYVHTHPV